MASEARATLIYEDLAPVSVTYSGGDAPRVPSDQLASATGWELRPEGLCAAGECIVVPPDREDELVGHDGDVNVAVLADLRGQPLVHDHAHGVWVVGRSSTSPNAALASGVAADFALPDLDGTTRRLSDYRGRKVLLVTWASW